jgi:hypothetical protein
MSVNAQRDEKGRFLPGNIYTKNIKRDSKGHFLSSAKKIDYSADKEIVNTLAKAEYNSMPDQPKSYNLSDIERAFYAGSNASRLYSLPKQWEIYSNKL